MAFEKRHKILIVDDDDSHRAMLKAVLAAEGHEAAEASDGKYAVELVAKEFYDLILMDIKMADMDGIEALGEIKKISPAIPILMMTAYASVKTAVEAMKGGAYDYLTKPIDIDELKLAISKTIDHFSLKAENAQLRERLAQKFDFSNIVGKSAKIRELFDAISLVAPTEATVLILGESGTGKELIANAIHENSPRRDRPFVKVNCAALPETLLESELFGHEKGSFTGAISSRQGRFELADKGTIFLDEVSEMSQATQAKLLRVLQEKEFERVGGSKTLKVDVRLIAATNRDLEAHVKNGKFREDLYYRLNVVPIHVPPLRERKEDVPLLAEHFLKIYSQKNNRRTKGFAPKSLDTMMRYGWPGNIRELENCVERAVILSRGDYVTPEELPASLQALAEDETERASGIQPGMSIKEVEKELILKTLEKTGGNRTKAAKVLGVTRRTLQHKIKEYGVKS